MDYQHNGEDLLMTERELARARLVRRIATGLALLVLLSLVFNFAIYPLSRQIRAQRAMPDALLGVMPSVVHVRVEDSTHGIRYGGTGFAIDSEGTIITNQHVVARGGSIVVTDWRGREHPAALLISDEELDLAVVRIAASTPGLLLSEDAWSARGQVVAYAGDFGAGDRRTSQTSVVSPRADVEGRTFVIVSGEASPGNSGGPLIDSQGRLVGVITSVGQGVTFAVPVNELRLFLRLHGLLP